MSVLFHSLACTSSWTADIAEEVLNRCVVGHSGFLGQFPLNESEYKITLSFEFFEDFQPPHVSEEDRLVASGYNTVLYFWKCNSLVGKLIVMLQLETPTASISLTDGLYACKQLAYGLSRLTHILRDDTYYQIYTV